MTDWASNDLEGLRMLIPSRSASIQALFNNRLTLGKILSHALSRSIGIVHCPDYDGEIAEESDVEFVDLDAKMAGLFRSSKRFYVVACNNCGAAIGSGVAGGGG